MGLCAETVHWREALVLILLIYKDLSFMFRNGCRRKCRWSKREIRQEFGEFCLTPVKKLTGRSQFSVGETGSGRAELTSR